MQAGLTRPESGQHNVAGPSRIAYLLSQYPAVSHTFFLGEILMMRQQGFHIETASINAIRPPADGFSTIEMEEVAQTFYVKQTSKLLILQTILNTLLTQPGVIWRGLREAVRLTPWDLRGMSYAVFYLIEAILVGAWMRRKGCDHLHVHFSGPVATVAMLTSIAWKVPYSLTVHGPDEFFEVTRSFLAKKVHHAKFVTCISFFARSQLLRLSPPDTWDKFHVCRLGVHTEVFAPVDRAEPKTLHILSVGRLHPSKGQIFLLKAFSKLLAQGLPIRLSIVGGGTEREALQRYIDENLLGDSVTLHGALSHASTRQLLGSADLFVLSSFAEGVPVALMEAMAMEIACVSTFVAGTPELIEHGKEGLLVPPASEEALAGAMAKLLSDGGLRQSLARAGRRKVLENYNIAINIGRLVEVFELHDLSRPAAPSSSAVSIPYSRA